MGLDRSELDSRLFDGFADSSRRRYVYVSNMSTGISRWSTSAVEEFGLPGEYMEGAGDIWAEHIHPEDRERYLKDIGEVFSGKKQEHCLDYRARNKEGEYVLCTCRGKLLKGEDGSADLFIGSIENHGIMDNVDAVTNLYNIYEFWNDLKKLKESDEDAMILQVKINSFSDVNEVYGYAFGNKVLRSFANMLREYTDTAGGHSLYRMDGAQFACCMRGATEDDVRQLCEKLRRGARHNIVVEDGKRLGLSISAGAVPYDREFDEYTIQMSANYALVQSRLNHQGELVLFDYNLLKNNKKNLEFMTAIRTSVANGCKGFYLCYQPIVGAKSEQLIGAEALLRWRNEEFGEVSPGIFIPWLENDPEFWELGNWIIKTALTQGKPLLQKYPDFILNVNLAYPQLSHTGFLEKVEGILEETGFPPENLCLELTERCRQLEKGRLKEIVDKLKSYGIKIAIDDFGTGTSSLNLLSELKVDTLKIDRGFIWDIQTNRSNQAIVKAVTGCADDLDVHVCMEGLEDRDMIDFVKRYDVYSYQGFHFSRPITMENFMEKYT